jgi:hypothetical protein
MIRQDFDVETIRAALDAVLTELMEERERSPREQRQRTPVDGLPSRDESMFADLAHAPREFALTLAVRWIGERLHEAGYNVGEMGKIAEDVAAARGSYGRRINVIDKKWNGIGGWVA